MSQTSTKAPPPRVRVLPEPGQDNAQPSAWKRYAERLREGLVQVGLVAVNLPVWALSWLWPKDPDLWVFGAWDGERYADNSRHLFEWLVLKHPEIKAVWTCGPELADKLEERGVPCVRTHSLKGYLTAIRAGVAVVSNSRCGDLNRYATAGATRVVQLWHGSPVQRVGWDEKPRGRRVTRARQRFAESLDAISVWLFPPRRETFDLLTSSSAHSNKHYESAFRIEPGRIATTGLARNDRLVHRRHEVRQHVPRILWLPTRRGPKGAAVDPLMGFDASSIEGTFAAHGAELWIRPHPDNTLNKEAHSRIEGFERVRYFECEDVHLHLDEFDVLVTDYSSVFTDWLLLDRPLIFFVPEAARQQQEPRDFYYDWDWVSPGPKVGDWNEFAAALGDALDGGKDWAEARERVRALFHDFADGQSCSRIYEAIRLIQDQRPERGD